MTGVSGTGTSKDVTGLTTGDSYVFRVQASNSMGDGTWSDASTAAVPADVAPGKPDAPTVAVLSATSLRVSWNAPVNTGSAITSYTLQQSANNGQSWSTVSGHSGMSHDVSGLTLGTAYLFRVRATNGAGAGAWSDASTAAQPNAVPGKPNPPTVTVLSATSLRVSWDAPVNTGSAITGYTLQQSEDNGQSWSAVSGVSGTSTSKDVTGLTTGDSYVFRVQATNTAGTGTSSEASTAAVPADVAPGKPDAPTVAVLSATSLRVSWNAPTNTGSAITSYTLQQSEDNGTNWSAVTGHSGTSHDVTGLTLGTVYVFRVQATNGAGPGTWSDASTAAQPNAVPDKPNPPTVTVLSATSLRVSWDAPFNTGSAITGYTLQQSEDNGQSWSAVSGVSGTSTSKDVTGLTTGDSYVFRVQATNTAGTGTSSEASTAAVPADVAPGKPDAPTVAVLSATSLRVSWNAPVNTGSAITSYTLQQSANNGQSWSTVSGHSGMSHDVSGLTLGTAYVFRVQATNGAGAGAWSDASTAAQPNAVPGKPNPPTVTVLSATSLRVSWDAPVNTGSAITGYTLQQSEDNGQSWSAVSGVSGTSTSKDVTGLTTGDSYVFRVQATNTAGTGTSSEASTAAVPADVAPGKPDAPTVAVLSATSLRVSWNAPTNTGSAITSYTLQQSEDNGTNWSAVTGHSGTSHDVTGLTLGTVYVFRVQATNGAGPGTWSDASTAAQPNAVPDKPNPPTVTVLSATSLRVSWDAPFNTGSAITGYTLQQSEDNGQSWSAVSGVSGTSTSKDVTGLTTGDSYVFRVQATNTAGTGTSSEASTAAVPADVAPGKPDAPTVAVLSATSLRVSWNAPVNTGSAITSYTLQQSANNGQSWSTVSGHSGMSHDVSGLTLGTAYVFRVQATNGAGAGAWSDASTAAQPNAVPGKPNPPTVTVLSATSLRVSWDAPVNTGSAITGYTLQQSEDNGQSWSAVSGVSGTSTSKDVTGLTTGDSYVFRVQATNTAGTGTSSEASTAAVPADVAPGKPDAPTVAVLSATSLRVSWNAPVNTGSAITSYTLEQSEDNGQNWSAVTGHSGTSHDVSGLTLGTAYVFRVQATNGAGPGAWSDASTAAQPNAAPGKPAAPTVTVLSATSLRVSWTEPFNTGSAITGYGLEQSTDAGQSWSAVTGVSGTGTSKDVTGLTTGDSYVFRVQATNTAGTGSGRTPRPRPCLRT